jgi:hypothetical protein
MSALLVVSIVSMVLCAVFIGQILYHSLLFITERKRKDAAQTALYFGATIVTLVWFILLPPLT